jgi:hypothetical protein
LGGGARIDGGNNPAWRLSSLIIEMIVKVFPTVLLGRAASPCNQMFAREEDRKDCSTASWLRGWPFSKVYKITLNAYSFSSGKNAIIN